MLLLVLFLSAPAEYLSASGRRPSSSAEEQFWLENMVRYHRFTTDEVAAATGMTHEEVRAALRKYDLTQTSVPRRGASDPLRVLPYPGGRHPRIGFLEGAVLPQRETKISVFTPWDDSSYVVVDVPEAIFSNLGLTYLAHTHIPTIWTEKNIQLPPLEWNRRADGTLESERVLPNGIAFGATIRPGREAVRMELWLRNRTHEPLKDLRVQNCVMLKGASGFAAQSSTNKLFAPPYAAVCDSSGQRWIITAWEPCHRTWANPDVPCLHSDPKFPDCAPNETVRLRGWLSFYESANIHAEFKRIEQTAWRQ